MSGGGQKLRAGEVVRIRVNPTDCLSVLDLLDVVGINYRAMSFSQCVSLALSSLMETARVHGTLPHPNGFEYLQRMQQFRGHYSQKKKLEITNTIQGIGSRFQAPPMPEVEDHNAEAEDFPAERPVTTEVRMASRALAELCAKRELAEQNSAVIWSNDDQAEYEKYYRVVYPGEPLV